jgi:hypothetical protein
MKYIYSRRAVLFLTIVIGLGVAYRDIRIPATPTLVTQTFRISGVDENGSKFDLNAVDLYTVSAGKISSKSSYWKRIQ